MCLFLRKELIEIGVEFCYQIEDLNQLSLKQKSNRKRLIPIQNGSQREKIEPKPFLPG